MILDLTPKDMFEAIGHDGSEIIWPDLNDPDCRRAFHIQECVRVAMDHMFTPIEIDADPHSIVDCEGATPYRVDMGDWLLDNLSLVSGVLLGRIEGRYHAVAWNSVEKMIYDPVGRKYPLDQFQVSSFYGMF